MATVVAAHRRLRLVAGPRAVLGGRVGHGARRRAGRPRLRGAGAARACPPRPTSTWSPPRCGRRHARSPSTPTRPGRRPAGPAGRHRPGRRCAAPSRAAASSSPGPARSPPRPAPTEDLAVLRGWLRRHRACRTGWPSTPSCAGRCSPRWSPTARPATDEIEAELAGDRTASGEREAALAHALVPTAETKAEVWAQLTGERGAAELAAPGAAAGLPAPGAGRADRAVRGEVLRRGRRDLGHPGQRAGAGVRVLRLPGATRWTRTRWRPPTPGWPATGTRPAAPAGRRGPGRRGAGAEGPREGRPSSA